MGKIAVIAYTSLDGVAQVVGDGDLVAVFRTVQGTIDHDLPAFGIIFRLQDKQIIEHREVTGTGPLAQLAMSQWEGR
jgi:hypothetical protein